MTRLYLIRHGQSEWNILNKIQGQTNTFLTDLGKQQALCIANKLVKENIDIIYTSDLARAQDTARTISQKIDKPLMISESIREIKFGPWEGLNTSQMQERYREEHLIWTKEPERLKVDGIETLEELKTRALGWVEEIIKENEGKNIAIVSHGATLKVLILGLLDMPLTHFKNLSISNVALSIIECRDYNRVLTKLNDTSHLKEIL